MRSASSVRQIAHRNALRENELQHAEHRAEMDAHAGEFLDDTRHNFLRLLEHPLDIFARDDLGGVGARDFREMRDQRRQRIDHGVAAKARVGDLLAADP